MKTIETIGLPRARALNDNYVVVWFASRHPLRGRRATHASGNVQIRIYQSLPSSVRSTQHTGVPIDLLAGDGLTPLHWALPGKNLAIMKLLIERGSPVDVRSAERATPLMNAVQGKTFDHFSFLLDHDANVNARDHRGFTALHRAAEMGHIDMVRVLLNRGAEPNPEVDGQTPKSLAEARGHAEIVALLNNGG